MTPFINRMNIVLLTMILNGYLAKILITIKLISIVAVYPRAVAYTALQSRITSLMEYLNLT